jgi:hypothetical protein
MFFGVFSGGSFFSAFVAGVSDFFRPLPRAFTGFFFGIRQVFSPFFSAFFFSFFARVPWGPGRRGPQAVFFRRPRLAENRGRNFHPGNSLLFSAPNGGKPQPKGL